MGKTIGEWQKEVYQLAVTKGWHNDPGEHKLPIYLINIHGEISEAWEEWRANHKPDELYYDGDKPLGIGVELADAFIRILDTCEAVGIDLEKYVDLKHAFNKTRSVRHGGKRA